MADHTKIEWTDATWNPITGCSIVSPGCTNCYAMALAGTRLKNHDSRKGLTKQVNGKHVWTGEVRFNAQWLDQPLRWTKPRMIFVCAHGDLFAEGVPDEWLDQVFAVMALCPQHTFQVLTKRPERMRDYLAAIVDTFHASPEGMDQRFGEICVDLTASPCAAGKFEEVNWPLPNVWLGVSVEDQRRADERIPILLDTPAAIRWISAEPLLGPVDLTDACQGSWFFDALRGTRWHDDPDRPNQAEQFARGLDWVVAGGESGPNARPMHPDWVRGLRDQCAAAAVPFLFKQWGSWAPSSVEQATDPRSGWRCLAGHPHVPKAAELYPENGASFVEFVGKRRAGRLLDGVEHNGYPGAAR